MSIIKLDDEIIDFVLKTLFNDGAYGHAYLHRILEAGNFNLTEIEYQVLLNKLLTEDLIEITAPKNYQIFPKYWEKYSISLSENGQRIIHKHKSYLKYLKYAARKEKESRFDRNIQNGNILITLLLLAASFFQTQCPTAPSKRQMKTEEEVKSLSIQLDSLRQVLQNIQGRRLPTISIDSVQK